MRKTANYTEAQGSGKDEDGGMPSANFVVAAQSREASVWPLARPSLLSTMQPSGHSSVSEDTFTRQARKCSGRKRFQDSLPRQSTKETPLKTAAACSSLQATNCYAITASFFFSHICRYNIYIIYIYMYVKRYHIPFVLHLTNKLGGKLCASDQGHRHEGKPGLCLD